MPDYIPKGYAAIVPYLVIDDAPQEIEFMTAVLGGTLEGRIDGPNGSVMNARVNINGSPILISTTMSGHGTQQGMLNIYVPDSDATFAKAIAFPGTTVVMGVADQFWGDRSGAVRTANGVTYWIASGKENLTHEQIAERLGMKK